MPAAALEHGLDKDAGHADQTLHVGFDDIAPRFGAALVETTPAADVMPGVIDQDFDRAQRGGNKPRQLRHRIRVVDVER